MKDSEVGLWPQSAQTPPVVNEAFLPRVHAALIGRLLFYLYSEATTTVTSRTRTVAASPSKTLCHLSKSLHIQIQHLTKGRARLDPRRPRPSTPASSWRSGGELTAWIGDCAVGSTRLCRPGEPSAPSQALPSGSGAFLTAYPLLASFSSSSWSGVLEVSLPSLAADRLRLMILAIRYPIKARLAVFASNADKRQL